MNRIVWAVLLVAALSGCDLARQQQAQQTAENQRRYVESRKAILDAQIRGCTESFKRGDLKTHVAQDICINDVISAAYSEMHYPYMDLVMNLSATRLRLGEQLDKGTMSDTEARAALTDAMATLISQQRIRDVQAANDAARNAALEAQIDAAQRRNHLELMELESR